MGKLFRNGPDGQPDTSDCFMLGFIAGVVSLMVISQIF